MFETRSVLKKVSSFEKTWLFSTPGKGAKFVWIVWLLDFIIHAKNCWILISTCPKTYVELWGTKIANIRLQDAEFLSKNVFTSLVNCRNFGRDFDLENGWRFKISVKLIQNIHHLRLVGQFHSSTQLLIFNRRFLEERVLGYYNCFRYFFIF